MTAPQRLQFIPCSNLYNGYGFTNATYGSGVTGFGYRPWSEVVPPGDADWIIPSRCPASDLTEYKPGQMRVTYWDWTELWLGYPSITYGWEHLDEDDIELIRTAYENAEKFCKSQVWFTLYNAELNTYRFNSGIIEPPTHDGFTGGRIGQNFKLTFSRIGFHANVASTGGTNPPYQSYVPTGLDFANNGWQL